VADEAARKKAQAQVEKDEAQRFADWVKIQEEAGYTVEGDSFATARVVELPDGPTHESRPGA
jgi:hypothetical protein